MSKGWRSRRKSGAFSVEAPLAGRRSPATVFDLGTSVFRRVSRRRGTPVAAPSRCGARAPVSRQPGPVQGGLMRTRVLAITAAVAVVIGSTSGLAGTPGQQWAVINLSEPTLIGSTIVQGPV